MLKKWLYTNLLVLLVAAKIHGQLVQVADGGNILDFTTEPPTIYEENSCVSGGFSYTSANGKLLFYLGIDGYTYKSGLFSPSGDLLISADSIPILPALPGQGPPFDQAIISFDDTLFYFLGVGEIERNRTEVIYSKLIFKNVNDFVFIDVMQRLWFDKFQTFEKLSSGGGGRFNDILLNDGSELHLFRFTRDSVSLLKTVSPALSEKIVHTETNQWENKIFVTTASAQLALYEFSIDDNWSLNKERTVFQRPYSTRMLSDSTRYDIMNFILIPGDSVAYLLCKKRLIFPVLQPNGELLDSTQFQFYRLSFDVVNQQWQQNEILQELHQNTWDYTWVHNIRKAPNGKILFIYHHFLQPPLYERDGYLGAIDPYTGKTWTDYVSLVCPNLSDSKCYHHFEILEGKEFKYLFFSLRPCDSTGILSFWADSAFIDFTWYFENGIGFIDTLVTKNPVYNFPHLGKFLVKVKASTSSGYTQWYSDSVSYFAPPKADFTFQDSMGCKWLGFHFYDHSLRDTVNALTGESWYWDFGDGNISTEQNPIHVYSREGSYTVRLIYSNGFCSDTIEKKQAVEILDAPNAGLKLDVSKGCTPLKVNISDKSAGQISSYFYTFGNGQSDTIPEPTVIYTTPGTYKIVQSLTGPTGCVTKDSALVHVMPGITAADTVEMLRATVQPDETVLVEWQPLTNAVYYRVTRDGEELPKQQSLTHTDHSAQPENRSYTYQVAAFDSCGNSSTASRIARTILLQGENISNEYALLTWNSYEEWQQGVQDYALQMRLPDGSWAPVTSTIAQRFEDADFLKMQQNEMCYRLIASEQNGNSAQSYSNVACVPYLPVLFIPNAFSPNGDGRNDVWQPLALAMKDYKLQVYNRWGQELFNTTDPFEGWDGKARTNARDSASVGEVLPEGTYLYRISAVSHTGQSFVRQGTVVVLR